MYLCFNFSKEHGTLRQMSTEKLVKTLPTLQNQLDALLDFECSTADLNNGVINSAFMLLFRDLIRLFACYNDGIINLLGKYYTYYMSFCKNEKILTFYVKSSSCFFFTEKYFDMNKKLARDALDIYKKFLIRMDRVADFLKVAEVSFIFF